MTKEQFTTPPTHFILSYLPDYGRHVTTITQGLYTRATGEEGVEALGTRLDVPPFRVAFFNHFGMKSDLYSVAAV